MKHMVLLFLLIAGSFFSWRYVMGRKDRRITSKWGGRVLAAVLCGAVAVLAMFAVLSLNSWRLF
jgi:hypothetical protein